MCERVGEVRDERQRLVWVTGKTQALQMNGSRKEDELACGHVGQTCREKFLVGSTYESRAQTWEFRAGWGPHC